MKFIINLRKVYHYIGKRTKEGYFIRFFNLEFAPLDWLIENGYTKR